MGRIYRPRGLLTGVLFADRRWSPETPRAYGPKRLGFPP